MEELKITIPEGYEIDINNSDITKGIIKFKRKEIISYQEIMVELNKKYRLKHWHQDTTYAIKSNDSMTTVRRTHVNSSEAQINSIFALVRLANVAAYYNDGWVPPTGRGNTIWFIGLSYQFKDSNVHTLVISKHDTVRYSCVYFKERKYAENAIQVLGEATIMSALTLNQPLINRSHDTKE